MGLNGTDHYAVLGNPVAHSRSPFIHTLFAQQTGQSLVYSRVLCPLDGFVQAVRDFAAQGGKGCNVTVPFKFEAPALVAHCTPRAQLAGAANVLKLDDHGWWADNSDGVGLVRDIEQGAGRPLRGLRVLLVGAGGAGAGVLGPLLGARPAQVVVANRSVDKARQLVQRHAAWAQEHGAELSATRLDAPGLGFDVVLNASSSSLQGAPSPVGAAVIQPGTLALDLMYGPSAQPFLAWARSHGAEPRDGLGMLVEQAAEAFHFWRGVRPQTTPVLAALRVEIAAGR
jgi:shikimate dehydrogenase